MDNKKLVKELLKMAKKLTSKIKSINIGDIIKTKEGTITVKNIYVSLYRGVESRSTIIEYHYKLENGDEGMEKNDLVTFEDMINK